MEYKVGDIYISKGKEFVGFGEDGKVITREFKKEWIILAVHENSITCESKGKYKAFEIKGF